MKKLELRANEITLTSTENEDKLVVEGYVNETNKWSYTMRSKKGPFIEKIEKGAFKKALAKEADIHFLAEHDKNKILASTRNGSLQLIEDNKGLLMRATISKTSYGKDYYELIKDGILQNMSFGFNVVNDNWSKGTDGTLQRSIKELNLFEVSVVTNPAYKDSAIYARGLNLVEEIEVPKIQERKLDTYEKIQNKLRGENTKMSKIEERVIDTTTNEELQGATNQTIDIMTEIVDTNQVLFYVRKKFVKRENISKNKKTLVQTGVGKATKVAEGEPVTLTDSIGNYKGIDAVYERYVTGERLTQKFINEVDITQLVEIPFAERIYNAISEDVVNVINTKATKKVTSETIDKTLIDNMYKAFPKKYLGNAVFVCNENTYNILADLYGTDNNEFMFGNLFIKGLPVLCVDIETETLQLANLDRAVQISMEEQPTFVNSQDTVEAIKGTRVFVSDLYASIDIADLDSVVIKG